jgi:hypothetical protein
MKLTISLRILTNKSHQMFGGSQVYVTEIILHLQNFNYEGKNG